MSGEVGKSTAKWRLVLAVSRRKWPLIHSGRPLFLAARKSLIIEGCSSINMDINFLDEGSLMSFYPQYEHLI